MPAQPRDELGAAADDARLRAAEQLVARERDEAGAGREALTDERLVADGAEAARAEVVDELEPGSCRELGQLPQRRPLREPDETEVGLMDAQDHRGVGGDRGLVV